MLPTDLYGYLMHPVAPTACSAFDSHVVASVLAIASVEASRDGRAFLAGVGLDRGPLLDLMWSRFPHARDMLEQAIPEDAVVSVQDDEACLRDLLSRNATEGTPFESCLATMIARRCTRPHHLWQDLGLRSRRELSWLMEQHFVSLASRNAKDMKWKKFLYRTICRDDGFLICVAPSCAECDDLRSCFGDEEGESLLLSP